MPSRRGFGTVCSAQWDRYGDPGIPLVATDKMAQIPTAETNSELIGSDHGQVSAGDIAVGVIVGRTSEFFDFFVYAIASVIVFPKLVFPMHDPLVGTLYSFSIFALAF